MPSSQFRKKKNIDSGHITKRSGRDHGDHRLYMESKVMSAEILILAYSKLEGDAMVEYIKYVISQSADMSSCGRLRQV